MKKPKSKSSAKPALSSPAKIKQSETIKHHYRVDATKTHGKYILRQGFYITEKQTKNISNGVATLVSIASESRPLTEAELIALAAKLGWVYKKNSNVYHLNISKQLKITSGYVTQNYRKIKDIKP